MLPIYVWLRVGVSLTVIQNGAFTLNQMEFREWSLSERLTKFGVVLQTQGTMNAFKL